MKKILCISLLIIFGLAKEMSSFSSLLDDGQAQIPVFCYATMALGEPVISMPGQFARGRVRTFKAGVRLWRRWANYQDSEASLDHIVIDEGVVIHFIPAQESHSGVKALGKEFQGKYIVRSNQGCNFHAHRTNLVPGHESPLFSVSRH